MLWVTGEVCYRLTDHWSITPQPAELALWRHFRVQPGHKSFICPPSPPHLSDHFTPSMIPCHYSFASDDSGICVQSPVCGQTERAVIYSGLTRVDRFCSDCCQTPAREGRMTKAAGAWTQRPWPLWIFIIQIWSRSKRKNWFIKWTIKSEN